MSTQSLYTFLSSIQLEHYHTAFLNSGASDQDLPLLIQLTDNELVEFLHSLNMLPFHVIKFKKSLRDINRPQSSSLSSEFIALNSIIYGKNASRALTAYEEAINHASFQIALKSPALISNKGELFDLAKKKLLEDGYQYKRGSSRSKLKVTTPTTSTTESTSLHKETTLIKRKEKAHRLSQARQEKMASLQQHLSLQECVTELKKLKEQERKHQWYKKRKQLLSISSLASNNHSYIHDGLPSPCSSIDEYSSRIQ